MRLGGVLRNVSSAFANDYSKLDCRPLSILYRGYERIERNTFVVCNDTTRELQASTGGYVAGGWLEKEEWLLRCFVAQLFDVFGVVSANSNNLPPVSA